MRFLLNDTVINFPSSLSEFTLGQRIDFYNLYGRELNKRQNRILEMEEGIEKEAAITDFAFDQMLQTFCFFANCTTEALKNSEFIDQAANIYYSSLAVLFDDEASLQSDNEFAWNKEVWIIDPPKFRTPDKMSFNELTQAKKIVSDLKKFKKGDWNNMLSLCAIYLIKRGEQHSFNDEKKKELMRSLPMVIALQVGLFLQEIVNLTTLLNTETV